MNKSPSIDENADLGLGDGLKPGAPPKDDTLQDEQQFTMLVHTPEILTRTSRSNSQSSTEKEPVSPEIHSSKTRSRFLDKIRKIKAGKNNIDKATKTIIENGSNPSAPLYAEIPLGTSIRQQRELFEHELNQMLGQSEIPSLHHSKVNQNGKIPLVDVDKEVVEKKLNQTKQEVEVLKQDLELCQRQLDAKYRAIKIMQGEAYAAFKGENNESKRVKLVNQNLRDEINKLQFEMTCRESYLMNSQETWTDRFDRVCQENVALMAALEEKSLEMKKIHAEKMNACRERDELLAFVDVQERQRFESSRDSTDGNEDVFYNNFSTLELAVLGACQCRGPSLEPCGCAQTAAKLKQEIARLKLKIAEQVKCLEEATIITDTYRMAFEEQLSRNRDLIKRFAEITAAPQMSRAEKAKAAIKWLIKQLNEDEYEKTMLMKQHKMSAGGDNNHTEEETFRSDIEELFASIPEDTGEDVDNNSNKCLPDKHDLQSKSETELIEVLVDMIADKSEALAHQRLTSKLLAKRNKELEQQLTTLTEGDDVFTKMSEENINR